MGNEITPTPDRRSFEELRRANQHGAEYWSARDLQPFLGYSQWRRFEEAVQRAVKSFPCNFSTPRAARSRTSFGVYALPGPARRTRARILWVKF